MNKLCHEMAELDGFGRADVSRVKSFLSSAWDDYRPPYAAGVPEAWLVDSLLTGTRPSDGE